MKRKSAIKKLAACVMAMAIAVSFMPASAFAASKTVSMTAYNQVYKTGSTYYCAGASGIYKVKVKNGKVKSKKRIVKNDWVGGPYSYYDGMKKKGKYLYYRVGSEGTWGTVNRVKLSGGKEKELAITGYHGDYAIKGKKIYFDKMDDEENVMKRVMKLNGTDKKKTSTKAKIKTKKSNTSGYSMKIKEKGEVVKDYLRTPKGTFYLGKCEKW